jgi:hypothetical protein
MEIMDKRIKDTIANKVLIEMDKKSLRWSNQYRLIPKTNGDYQLVVDMRGVNQFMKLIHFKMEGIPTLEQLLMKKDFAISHDLKEAYNHVPLHPTMQGLLGIQYRGRLYKYQGMPFGLTLKAVHIPGRINLSQLCSGDVEVLSESRPIHIKKQQINKNICLGDSKKRSKQHR